MLHLFYHNQIKRVKSSPKYKILKVILNKIKKQFKMKIQIQSQSQSQNNKMHHLFYKIQKRNNKIHKKIQLNQSIKKMNPINRANLLIQKYRIKKLSHKKRKNIKPQLNKNKSQKKLLHSYFQIQIKKKIKKKNLKKPYNPKSKLKKLILQKKNQFKLKSPRIKMHLLFYQIQIKKRIPPLIQSNNQKQF